MTLRQVEKNVIQEGESKRQLRSGFLRLNIIQILYKMTVIFVFLLIGIFNFSINKIEIGSLAMLITFSMTLSNIVGDLATRLYELIDNFARYKQVLENIQKSKKETTGTYTFVQDETLHEGSIQVSDLMIRADSETILGECQFDIFN